MIMVSYEENKKAETVKTKRTVETIYPDLYRRDILTDPTVTSIRGKVLGIIGRLSNEKAIAEDAPRSTPSMPFYQAGVTPTERTTALKLIWGLLNQHRELEEAQQLLIVIEEELTAPVIALLADEVQKALDKEASVVRQRALQKQAWEARQRAREENTVVPAGVLANLPALAMIEVPSETAKEGTTNEGGNYVTGTEGEAEAPIQEAASC